MTSDQAHVCYQAHNHAGCIDQAIGEARQLCQQKSLRFTAIREQVLTCIWLSHQPVGAYDILQWLQQQDKNIKLAPPTVYRALDFLQQNGLIHRIATLNAYMGCCSPGHAHQSQFLICRDCKTTVELADANISQPIHKAAAKAGFAVDVEHVEILGLCPNCQTGNSTGKDHNG